MYAVFKHSLTHSFSLALHSASLTCLPCCMEAAAAVFLMLFNAHCCPAAACRSMPTNLFPGKDFQALSIQCLHRVLFITKHYSLKASKSIHFTFCLSHQTRDQHKLPYATVGYSREQNLSFSKLPLASFIVSRPLPPPSHSSFFTLTMRP